MTIDVGSIVELAKSVGLFVLLIAMLGAGFHYTSKKKKDKGGNSGSSSSSSSDSSNNTNT